MDQSRDYPFCPLSRYALRCNICGRADKKTNLKLCFNVFHPFMPDPETGEFFQGIDRGSSNTCNGFIQNHPTYIHIVLTSTAYAPRDVSAWYTIT